MKDLKNHLMVLPILLMLPIGAFMEISFKNTSIYPTLYVSFVLFYLIYVLIMVSYMSYTLKKEINKK